VQTARSIPPGGTPSGGRHLLWPVHRADRQPL